MNQILPLATILSNAASNADAYSSAVKCEKLEVVRLLVYVAVTSNPVAVVQVEGTEDADLVEADKATGVYGTGSETARWVPLTLPEGCVHVKGGASFSGPSASVAVNNASLASSILIILGDVPAYVRVFYDRTSGGGASGVTARAAGRG